MTINNLGCLCASLFTDAKAEGGGASCYLQLLRSLYYSFEMFFQMFSVVMVELLLELISDNCLLIAASPVGCKYLKKSIGDAWNKTGSCVPQL